MVLGELALVVELHEGRELGRRDVGVADMLLKNGARPLVGASQNMPDLVLEPLGRRTFRVARHLVSRVIHTFVSSMIRQQARTVLTRTQFRVC